MISLSINNSISSLQGLSLTQLKAVKKLLSYREGPKSQYVRTLLSKKGEFPTGNLDIVKKYLFSLPQTTQVTVIDSRTKPMPILGAFNLNLRVSPTQDQRNAATALLERYRGIVVASTGYGKSLIIGLIINLLKVRTLIVVPSLELKEQLTESLRSWFPKESGSIGGFGHTIAVENIDSSNLDNDAAGYDCLIIDEFHRSAAKTYRKLNITRWNGIFYRCGLTATAFRAKDEEKLLLESVLAQVIYTITFQDAVNQSRIVPIEAYAITVPKSKIKPERPDNYREAYESLIVNKPERNSLIVGLVKNLYLSGESTLVLVNEISHGIELQKSLLAEGCEVKFANGQDKESRDMIKNFSDGVFPVLIGSSILAEGVDTRACEWVVLAGGPGSSRGQLMQKAGRGVRKYRDKVSAKVITFIENEHLWFRKHHAKFIETMREEYGIAVINLEKNT